MSPRGAIKVVGRNMPQSSDASLLHHKGGRDKTGGRKKGEEEEQMSSLWFALKRTLKFKCDSSSDHVHDPKAADGRPGTISTRTCAPGCCGQSSKPPANVKTVVHGSKTRHVEKPSSCSPRSIGSSEFLNPITHDVMLENSRSELKITGFGGYKTPQSKLNGERRKRRSHRLEDSSSLSSAVFSPRSSAVLFCQKCDEQFLKLESLEAHHLAKHAVAELVEGDSSRKIVEMICKTGLSKSDGNSGQIERILKVHNLQRTVASFEEYREMVKLKASKLQKKHPRCLADGNELLRFHGTTMTCSTDKNDASGPCVSETCAACRILRQGFSREEGAIGVFTTATSGRAFESISINGDDPATKKKALFVCRVIAGRVHKPLDNNQVLADQSGFDSLAGKVGSHANIEELYLLNQRALLPCFLVIFKP